MRSTATLRITGGAAVAAVALLSAVVTGRVAPAIVAAPFLVAVAFGLALGGRPSLRVAGLQVSPARVLVDDLVVVEATVHTSASGHRARVRLQVPQNLELVDSDPEVEVLCHDGMALVRWTLVATGWGGHGSLRASATVMDRFGLYTSSADGTSGPLRVLPREEHLRRILSPRSLRSVLGGHASRQRGDGVEFADMRPFVPGDLARSINWRVSARRGELWVDDRHPDRSGEVVLFLDSFVRAGSDQDDTLRRTVELAGSLAARHLAANDRLGLVDLGGVFRWVRPAGGSQQLYRIVDALTDTQVVASVADKPIEIIPVRALPRRSLVVAMTPLLDPRSVATIVRMRAQSFDVAVVEVSPEEVVDRRADERGEMAHRLWRLEREMVRSDLRRQGVGVARWPAGEPVDPVLDELLVHRQAVTRWAR